MKHQTIGKILALILSLCLLFALTGCGERPGNGGTATVTVEGGKTYTVPLSEVTGENGLFSVLDYLKEKDGLVYETASGMLTSVDSLSQDPAAGKYIYIYTSVEEDFDVSVYAEQKTVGGRTLTSAGVGAAQMHVKDGAVVYIGTVVWQ